MLSDDGILRAKANGQLAVEPFDERNLQSASIDVTLGCDFLIPAEEVGEVSYDLPIDPRLPDAMVPRRIAPSGVFVLPPLSFVLACTAERIDINPELAAVLDGKSSIGRLALMVHITAGYVDPGWADRRLTLELFNLRRRPILLHPGMLIGQLRFLRLETPSTRPYGSPGLGSKYLLDGVEASRYHENGRGKR